MSDIALRLRDGADRFLKWAHKQQYSGPPVISIPVHDGNIDRLMEEAAKLIEWQAVEIVTLRSVLATAREEGRRAGIEEARGAINEEEKVLRRAHEFTADEPSRRRFAEWQTAFAAAKSAIRALKEKQP